MEERKVQTESDKEQEAIKQKESEINQKIIDSRKVEVFKNIQILTSRPKDMDFEEYRKVQRIQNIAIKKYLSITRYKNKSSRFF